MRTGIGAVCGWMRQKAASALTAMVTLQRELDSVAIRFLILDAGEARVASGVVRQLITLLAAQVDAAVNRTALHVAQPLPVSF